MPDEPEHNLDKPLRAWAERRRQEAKPDLALHPVNRRQLQDEVRRQYPTTSGHSWLQSLLMLWPRLAIGLGLFIVLGVVVLQLDWTTYEQPMEMAKDDSSSYGRQSSEAPSNEPSVGNDRLDEAMTQAATKPTVLPQVQTEKKLEASESSPARLAENEVTLERGLRPTDPTSRTSQPPEATQPLRRQVGPAEELRLEANQLGQARSFSQDEALRKAEPVPASSNITSGRESITATAEGATGGKLASATSSPAQFYRGVSTVAEPRRSGVRMRQLELADAENAADSTNVLMQFELLQSANQVRVLDRDGSLYEGNVVTNSAVASTPSSATTVAGLAVAQSPAAPAEAFSFQVAGTNRSSGQSVALSGLIRTNQATILADQLGTAEADATKAKADTDGLAFPTLTLEGWLQVGTNAPVRVQAYQLLP